MGNEISIADTPENIDLVKLAKDTNQALGKLEPYYNEGSKRPFLFIHFGGLQRVKQEVATQTTRYVRAIDASIDASKFGHTLAEEAIGLMKVPGEDVSAPAPDAYSTALSNLAARWKNIAADVLKLFLDAREQLKGLISKYKDEDDVEDCLDALMNHQPTLHRYVAWWDHMTMKHNLITVPAENQPSNKIHYQDTLKRWQDHNGRCVLYNESIRLTKTKFPELFQAVARLVPKPEKQSAAAATTSDTSLLSPPTKINLLKLANDTSHALEKLAPFYVEGSKRSFPGFGGPRKLKQEVTTQTRSYVRAIHGSIDASKFGHTLAEEAMGVVKYILKQGELTPDVDKYFSTASDLTAQGKDKAASALELFLDAERELKVFTSKYEKAGDMKEIDRMMMKDCLDALLNLKSTLDQYVGWWNEMEMKHSTVQTQTALKFNRIRYETILEQWQDLKERYVEYNKTIRLAEVNVPELFQADTNLVSLPGKINLSRLAKDTTQALEKLAPVYIVGRMRASSSGGPSKGKQEIVTQTASYVQAINGSIDASKFGRTSTMETIEVTKYILTRGAESAPDLDDYLSTASELAVQGKGKAAGTLKSFLDVKSQLDGLLSKYDENKENDQTMAKDSFDAMMTLRSTLDQYIGWWSEMDKKHNIVEDRTRLNKFNKAHYQTILEECQNLNKRYADYDKTINSAQSNFPEVFQAMV